MIFELDFSTNSLTNLIETLEKESLPTWMAEHLEFLKKYNSFNEFELHTSGTTGAPKFILVTKMQMQFSAAATLSFFNLKPGMTSLLCLSSNYIAGKMMLVRAVIGRLKLSLIEPTSDPSAYITTPIDFIPLVPLQAENVLTNKSRNFIKTLLIGGGPVNSKIKELLFESDLNVFESFGTTETLTHFALKRVYPEPENHFKTLPGFKVHVNENSELILEENDLTNEEIHTKDVVKLIDHSHFVWLGRTDNMINSGGIKIFPEELEDMLKNKIINQQFIITDLACSSYGRKVVLVIEGNEFEFDSTLLEVLERRKRPKQILFLKKFPRTESGKIKRNEIKQLINA